MIHTRLRRATSLYPKHLSHNTPLLCTTSALQAHPNTIKLSWRRLWYFSLLTSSSVRGHDLLADVQEAPKGHIDAAPTPPAADQEAGTIIDETVIARP